MKERVYSDIRELFPHNIICEKGLQLDLHGVDGLTGKSQSHLWIRR